MNEHTEFEEMIPLYVAGQLTKTQKTRLEVHLNTCKECRREVDLWSDVSQELIQADQLLVVPPGLPENAIRQLHSPNIWSGGLKKTWQLLQTQALLVRTEMWFVSALVMGMALLVAAISEKIAIIYFVFPLVSASTLAFLYGSDNDPAFELSRSTATSPWKILFARLSIISIYNLLLGMVSSYVLSSFIPTETLETIFLGWFAPLAFLSSLALLLSIWLDTGSAIAISYGLWVIQYLPNYPAKEWANLQMFASFLTAYKAFWKNPILLISMSVLLLFLALWSANKPVFRSSTHSS